MSVKRENVSVILIFEGVPIVLAKGGKTLKTWKKRDGFTDFFR